MKCIDCALFSWDYCRLKYKNPVTGEKLLKPITCYEARSYMWACSSAGSYGCAHPSKLYESMFGVFSEDECKQAFMDDK